MKTLYESILDIDDNERNFDKNIKNQIKQFIKDNFKGHTTCKISKNPNGDGKYEVSSKGDVVIENRKITSLTNNLFVWSEISGDFDCYDCNSLTSLKGAPEKVGRNFSCSNCYFLTSLEGAPKEVGGSFYCSNCNSLTSLEGAPKEVGGSFYCHSCKSLKSLEGAPKEVGMDFNCYGCKSLTSLEGAPEKVGEDFRCRDCGKRFAEEDVKKVSDVKGKIYC